MRIKVSAGMAVAALLLAGCSTSNEFLLVGRASVLLKISQVLNAS